MFEGLKIKKLLKKTLTKEEYLEVSYNIKCDREVIEHLINCDPSSISVVPSDVDIFNYIEENYSLVNYLNEEQLNDCFELLDFSKVKLTQDLFNKLTSLNQKKVFLLFPNICIYYLEGNEKINVIVEIITAKSRGKEFNDSFSPDKFSDEDLNHIILNLSEHEFVNLFNSNSRVKDYIINIFLSLDDKSLDDVINLLTSCYEDLPKNLKDKIELKNAQGNLNLILKLSKEAQIAYFLEHLNELFAADRKIIRDCLEQYKNLTADVLFKYGMISDSSLFNLLQQSEKEKIFSRNFLNVWYQTHFGSENLDSIIRGKLNKVSDKEKKDKLLELYNSLSNKKIFPLADWLYYREDYQISRLIYDENIINNNSADLLKKYKETYDRSLLLEILTNAYGSHVIEIFKERPDLNLLDIENFKIFDKEIYNKLGKNFIHHILNCELDTLNYLIGKFVEDRETLNTFANYFNCIIKEFKTLDLNKITKMMEIFVRYEEIIKEIDFNNINEKTIRNLQLLISDDDMLSAGIRSIYDLENYTEFRSKKFIEIGRSATTGETSMLKNLILSYVFGKNVSSTNILEDLSFYSALKVFNISNLIKNEDVIKKMGLTKDEVSMLILLYEINRINNIEDLKNVFEALVNRGLNSTLFENTFEKIKFYYIEDVKKNLLSKNMLDSMPKNNVSGVEVVEYEGDSFTLICSVLGLYISSGNIISGLQYGEDLLNDWLNRENGTNVISTAVVSSDTNIYPVDKKLWKYFKDKIIFVFGDDVDIIGMGGTDISSEHNKRSRKHHFNYIDQSDKDIAFSTMEELKQRIIINNRYGLRGEKFESEITIARREEDIRKLYGGLKRVMPIGLYVIGEITQEQLETARVFNEYYEQNGLGKFRIIKVNPTIYKGRGIVESNIEKGEKQNGKCI